MPEFFPLKVYPFFLIYNPIHPSLLSWFNVDKTDVSFMLFSDSVKYRQFSVKSKPIITLSQTMELRLLDFHCLGLLFFFFQSNSQWLLGLKLRHKALRRGILVWNYVRRLTLRARTTDVAYCAETTLFFCTWRQADYRVLWHFLCVDFLRCISSKFIWPHFQGTKLWYIFNIMALNTLNKTKLTRNG